MQRIGLPDQFENLIADLDFGLAEEGAFFGNNERPGDGEELIAGLLFHLGGELLGLDFLLRSQRGRGHWGSSRASELDMIILNYVELYRSCTNSGAAYPIRLNPEIKVKEIISTLAARGITVGPNLVYLVKGKLKGEKNRRRKVNRAAATVATNSGSTNAVQTTLKVKALATEVGGLDTLRELVDALSA
jgi:hypothetical protein